MPWQHYFPTSSIDYENNFKLLRFLFFKEKKLLQQILVLMNLENYSIIPFYIPSTKNRGNKHIQISQRFKNAAVLKFKS